MLHSSFLPFYNSTELRLREVSIRLFYFYQSFMKSSREPLSKIYLLHSQKHTFYARPPTHQKAIGFSRLLTRHGEDRAPQPEGEYAGR